MSLRVSSLVAGYGDQRVLHGVDVEVASGEVVGLLGPNGAGKTTLVSVIAGLMRPTSGEVRFDGPLGLAGQDIGVYPTHTVLENLRFFGAIGGLSGPDLETSVDRIVDALDLGPQRDRKARELSGGQQRRLHAGCALVHRPGLVLLDEPTAGADPQTRQRLLELVRDLAAGGASVLYTTHYLTEIEDLGARVIVLSGGRVRAEGSVESLIAEHTRSELVLRFDGPAPEVSWPDAVVTGSELHLPTASPAVDIVKAVESVGRHSDRLLTVDLARSDLERAYLSIIAEERACAEL